MEGNALQEKSNMLDEVNKLLDLMVDEKKCLHQKIAKLELQLESNPCQGKKLEKIIQTDPQHEAAPPITSDGHCVSDLVAIVMQERARLKEMEHRMEQVNTYCNQERGAAQVELQKTNELLHRSDSNLRAHKRETKTLEAKLSAALKVQKELKDSNDHLHLSLEETRMKYMKARTSLLAIRGRRSVDLKRTNKIEQDNERRDLMSNLEKEQEKKSRLQKQLQAKEREVVNFKTLVANKEDQLSILSEKYEELRLGVEESLNRLSKDLKSSRKELESVRKTLQSKQEQLDKTYLMLQEERRKSAHLLSQSCSTVTHLTSQLEKERKDLEEQQHTMSTKMVELQTQHAIEMDRLRDISARRCKELAREVWTLKETKK